MHTIISERVLKGQKMKSIGHTSPTAEVVATALALRQRNRGEVNIWGMWDRLVKDNEKVEQKEFLKFWKDLENEGAGSLVFGRRGKQTRFIPHYSLKSIGKSMLEGSDIETDKIVKKAEKQVKTTGKKRGRPLGSKNKLKMKTSPKHELKEIPVSATGKVIFVGLRKDFNVEINLPVDINGSEINMIYTALKRAL